MSQEATTNERPVSGDRREALATIARVSAYVAPVLLASTLPTRASAASGASSTSAAAASPTNSDSI